MSRMASSRAVKCLRSRMKPYWTTWSVPLRKVCLALALAAMPEAAAGACETAGFKGLDGLRLNRPVPGRVISGFGMRKHPFDTIEQALMADGASTSTAYPCNLDRAFSALDRVKPDVAVWWTSGAQLEQMLKQGYNLGGEPSGHIILSDYATTGDGFVAALQVLAVVQKLRRPVSEVCHRFDPLPQILKNVRYRSGKPLDDAEVKSAIMDGENRLNGHGRLLVRSSGTEPVIRVMGEGDDRMLVEDVVDQIVNALGDAAAEYARFIGRAYSD